MKKTLFALLLITVSLWAYKLEPIKVTDDIYCYIGDFNPPTQENGGYVSNICLVKNGKDVILIDAGPTYSFAKLLDGESKHLFSKAITKVVVTNYHDDRLLGASYFEERGIQIFVAKGTKEVMQKNRARYDRILQGLGERLTAKTTIPTKLTELKNDEEEISKGVFVKELSPAAESPTDLIVYIPTHSFIFAGNILFDDRMLFFAEDSSMDGWLEAIEKIKELKPKYLVMGHGANMSATSYKTTYDYLQSLKSQLSALYEEGLEYESASKKVDLESFSYLKHFDTLNGVNIYNYYQDLEWGE